MAKYYGRIGFIRTEGDSSTGVWKGVPTEKSYYGDVVKHRYKSQFDNGINPNIGLSTEISILADDYAYQNFQYIAYAEYMGVLWNVTDVSPDRPRITLTIGGVYHGEQA